MVVHGRGACWAEAAGWPRLPGFVVVGPVSLGRASRPRAGGHGEAGFGPWRGMAEAVDGDVEDRQGGGLLLGAGPCPGAGGGRGADPLVLLAARSASSPWA